MERDFTKSAIRHMAVDIALDLFLAQFTGDYERLPHDLRLDPTAHDGFPLAHASFLNEQQKKRVEKVTAAREAFEAHYRTPGAPEAKAPSKPEPSTSAATDHIRRAKARPATAPQSVVRGTVTLTPVGHGDGSRDRRHSSQARAPGHPGSSIDLPPPPVDYPFESDEARQRAKRKQIKQQKVLDECHAKLLAKEAALRGDASGTRPQAEVKTEDQQQVATQPKATTEDTQPSGAQQPSPDRSRKANADTAAPAGSAICKRHRTGPKGDRDKEATSRDRDVPMHKIDLHRDTGSTYSSSSSSYDDDRMSLAQSFNTAIDSQGGAPNNNSTGTCTTSSNAAATSATAATAARAARRRPFHDTEKDRDRDHSRRICRDPK